MHTFPLGLQNLTTSVYSPSGNGGVERVYNTMATVLAMVCNEHKINRALADSSRTTSIVPDLCPTLYPLEPPSGTTPLTVPGG